MDDSTQRMGALRDQWESQGYLAFPNFFADDQIDQLNELIDGFYRRPPSYLVVDNTVTGRRAHLRDFPENERAQRTFKLNDLYLERPEVREIALQPRVRAMLAHLLNEPVVLCNSLSFEKGSQQPAHIDSLYMTPPTPGQLVATWVALEDAHPDAGQLFYYPGSHKIPLYTFSNGTHHSIREEHPAWNDYIHENMDKLGCKKEMFPAKKGDLFIWHANLVHGGSTIHDTTRTRRSLVCHYFGLKDCQALGSNMVPVANNAYWMKRPHPPVSSKVKPPSFLKRLTRRLASFGQASR